MDFFALLFLNVSANYLFHFFKHIPFSLKRKQINVLLHQNDFGMQMSTTLQVQNSRKIGHKSAKFCDFGENGLVVKYDCSGKLDRSRLAVGGPLSLFCKQWW